MSQMRRLAAMVVTWAMLGGASVAVRAADVHADAADSVVKVLVTAQQPRYAEPWTPGWSMNSQGSGLVVDGRRILTAAHVVVHQTLVRVQKYGSPEKCPARVLFVSHEADLALLTVDDPGFFEGLHPLELGELPSTQQEVFVLGFPVGGETLSITKGVVSRVEHRTSAHSIASLLALQIDAAVNPGNSGGPVVSGGKVTGVVTQTLSGEQNISYATSAPVIRHFLDDVVDGRYDGVPSLGINTQRLDSPALKGWLRMQGSRTGVRVTDVAPGSPASRVLVKDDVLLTVAGHAIADDGTIEFRPRERTRFDLYVDERQVGERLPLTIWRDGAERTVEVALDWPWPCGLLVRYPEYEQRPRYFVFGGLVFGALDWQYLTSFQAGRWPTGATALWGRWAERPDEEPVILNKVLPAAVNKGYEDLSDRLITQVDGVKPRNLADLVRLVESGVGEYVRFTDVEGREIVLSRREAVADGPAVLATYQIPADRSAQLVPRDYLLARGVAAPIVSPRPAGAGHAMASRENVASAP
jgi:S1-C subfamily serine protease